MSNEEKGDEGGEVGKMCERAAAILNVMGRQEGAIGRRQKAGGRCAPIRPFPARLAEDGKLVFGRYEVAKSKRLAGAGAGTVGVFSRMAGSGGSFLGGYGQEQADKASGWIWISRCAALR
jgi:hypothetical protein